MVVGLIGIIKLTKLQTNSLQKQEKLRHYNRKENLVGYYRLNRGAMNHMIIPTAKLIIPIQAKTLV